MPLPFLPTDYEQLLTYWNRVQNRYKYRDQGSDMNLLRTMRAAYYAAISFIDYQLGRIFEALVTEGILDDTLILFTSDHGELLGDYNSYGKRSFLDVAARVPLLARYPERFPANVQCDYPASLVDVLPTCLQAAGSQPGDEHIGVDLGDLVDGVAARDRHGDLRVRQDPVHGHLDHGLAALPGQFAHRVNHRHDLRGQD